MRGVTSIEKKDHKGLPFASSSEKWSRAVFVACSATLVVWDSPAASIKPLKFECPSDKPNPTCEGIETPCSDAIYRALITSNKGFKVELHPKVIEVQPRGAQQPWPYEGDDGIKIMVRKHYDRLMKDLTRVIEVLKHCAKDDDVELRYQERMWRCTEALSKSKLRRFLFVEEYEFGLIEKGYQLTTEENDNNEPSSASQQEEEDRPLTKEEILNVIKELEDLKPRIREFSGYHEREADETAKFFSTYHHRLQHFHHLIMTSVAALKNRRPCTFGEWHFKASEAEYAAKTTEGQKSIELICNGLEADDWALRLTKAFYSYLKKRT